MTARRGGVSQRRLEEAHIAAYAHPSCLQLATGSQGRSQPRIVDEQFADPLEGPPGANEPGNATHPRTNRPLDSSATRQRHEPIRGGLGGRRVAPDAEWARKAGSSRRRDSASAALDSTAVVARSGMNRDRPEKEGLRAWAAERPEGSADQSLSGTPTRDSKAANEMWNS